MPTTSDLDAYYAFDAGNGSGVPTEDVWEAHFKHLMLPGVLAGEPSGTTPGTTELEVYGDSTGLQVKVRSGRTLMMGHAGWITAEKTLAIDTADATNPRIDLVVLRLQRTDNKVQLATVTGTPAASPTAPALTQNATIHEELLAYVAVAAGAVTIAAADVTDKRRWAVPDLRGLPSVRVVRTSDQTGVATGTEPAVSWSAASYQTGGLWWTSGDPTKLYVPRAGLYQVSARLGWDANSAGTTRSAAVLVNGSTRGLAVHDSPPAQAFVQAVSGPVLCAAGDYLTLAGFHDSGSNRTFVRSASYAPALEAYLVRPV